MFALFHLDVAEMTIVLAFGGLVVIPIFVGIAALWKDCQKGLRGPAAR
jgi:hypothetical protein